MNQNELAPPAAPARFLNIDEEGYFLLDGLRVSDAAIGHSWLSKIRMDERGRAFLTDEQPGRILIECFDQPLIALDVEVIAQGQGARPKIKGRFPYGFEAEILADSFRADEWDRFYARTVDGVPLVFGRAAQNRLFQSASEYDDDSITFGEGDDAVTLPMQPLYQEIPESKNPEWWSNLYDKGETPWDDGEAHPRLEKLIPPLKITRCRVLVLGCGSGHDAAWWEKRGHIVTAIDFSNEALERARKLYGERDTLRWVQADAFKLPTAPILAGIYDIIFEHTMFCAIHPSRREELIRVWYRLLSRRGRLIGFIPVMDKLIGPPFGASEWEIRKRLLDAPQPAKSSVRRARFLPLLWNRVHDSKEKWLGRELFLVVERADSLTE